MESSVKLAGECSGRLSVRQEGLYTVIEVHTDKLDGLRRIWIHGGERHFCLGILQPDGDGMTLRRRFTRRELAALPDRIEYASDEDGGETKPPAVNTAEHGEESGRLWYRSADGCLTSRDGDRRLIAIPSALTVIPRGADVRRIEGQQYIVFKC